MSANELPGTFTDEAVLPFCPSLRYEIAQVPIDRVTLDEASSGVIAELRARAGLRRSGKKPLLIMGPNAQLITLARRNARFAAALRSASLNTSDGISVVAAARLLRRPVPERVTGGDLMERLCAEAARHNLSVFLLGGLPEAARMAASVLQRRYPGLRVAGTCCPPYGFEHDATENARVRKLIRDATPDLLFVALGAPKQEIWMHENCLDLPISAAMSVGAAFDTQAGLRKRAPRWTNHIGLEWLFRLGCEPRRLWKRYLFGNAHFVYLVFRQLLVLWRFAPDHGDLPSHQKTDPFISGNSPALSPFHAEPQL